MYYGPEFVAKKVQDWIKDREIGALFIEPGSPWQNGHNESFNGVFRDGCLDRWYFESLREAREASESWLHEYNEFRPHSSLGERTPSEVAGSGGWVPRSFSRTRN
jgi:putative transposase